LKRFAWFMTVLVAAGLVTAATAWAVKPEKSPAPAETYVDEAGTVCPFALRTEPIADRGTQTLHFDRSGEIRWIHGSGHIVLRFTNLENQKSVDLNVSGPGKVTFGDDGSIHVDGEGGWAVTLLEGDVLPDGSPWTAPTVLFIKGHLRLSIAEDGTLTVESYVGTVQNVCDMLAD
jgi:hypothetical protein